MKINNVTIKTPTTLKVGVFRITESERVASGEMAMEIIAIKRRLDMAWEIIEDFELKKIMDILESGVFYTVEYPDPQWGENAKIAAYVGDINTEAWQKVGSRHWRGVSISLIQQ